MEDEPSEQPVAVRVSPFCYVTVQGWGSRHPTQRAAFRRLMCRISGLRSRSHGNKTQHHYWYFPYDHAISPLPGNGATWPPRGSKHAGRQRCRERWSNRSSKLAAQLRGNLTWWWERPDTELRQPGGACHAPRVGTKRPPSLPARHRSSSVVSTEIGGARGCEMGMSGGGRPCCHSSGLSRFSSSTRGSPNTHLAAQGQRGLVQAAPAAGGGGGVGYA